MRLHVNGLVFKKIQFYIRSLQEFIVFERVYNISTTTTVYTSCSYKSWTEG